jgi:methionyl-tRNA synthetase
MREVAFGQDGSYSAEAIVTRGNAELANSFGNLAQRTLSMIFKNLDGRLCEPTHTDVDRMLFFKLQALSQMRGEFDRLKFSDGLEHWMQAVFACNQYVDEQAPWALRKTDPERMATVLMTLFQCVHDLATAIRPVVPAAADKLLDQMGIAPDQRRFAALENDGWFADLVATGFRVAQPIGVFPRLDMPAEDAA